MKTAGQMTWQPLISGEQFGIGGARSVRGYEEREVAGENGQQFNLELWTPYLPYNTQFLLFGDAGRIERETPHPSQTATEALSSAGMGWRWYWRNYLNVSVDLATVFKDTTVTTTGDHRLLFNIFLRF